MTARYLIFFLTGLSIAGCDNGLDRPIHFVLPDDYTGPFVIISNSDHPDRIVKYADRYQLTVPRDGVIRTENIDIFRRWHRTSAAYSDGTVLVSPGDASNQFHKGDTGTSDNQTYHSWYFVGPQLEFDDKSSWPTKKWLESRGLSH